MIKFFNSSFKKIIFPVVLFSFLGAAPYYVDAQTRHWKSVILPGHSWSYILPTNQTTADWIQLGYDDALWSVGNTGIGYGDDDDETVVSTTISLFMRKTFEITDASLISRAVLDIDYDDGFVAYINGVEIARDLFSGNTTSYQTPSDGLHEARLPSGAAPERFYIDKNLLTDGTNIIAVQVHNQSINSSDLSALPVLSFELPEGIQTYYTTPSWFVQPTPEPVEIDLTSSNLPIVIVNTNGADIPDKPKIDATMKIINRPDGELNYVSDESNPDYLDFDAPIQIEVRGSTSQLFSKKQYSLTTYDNSGDKDNVKLLDLPKENDWILNAFAYDTTFVRDYISYKLSNSINQYASRAKYCELILNGEYRGIYMLLEKLKADDNRINLKKIDTDDIEYPNISGGYIVKADKIEGTEVLGWSMGSYGWGAVNYAYDLPKPEDLISVQDNYIQTVFNQLVNTSSSFNSSLDNGYPSVIDIPSFVDFMLLNELASNVDAYQFSTFFHKDRGGKLRAGPIWDFNLTYGNDLFEWGYDRSRYNIWQFSDGNRGSTFWTDLFNDVTFSCYFAKRWKQLTADGQPLSEAVIHQLIDETVTEISDAVDRQEQIWNREINFEERIANIKTFISQRIQWITNQLDSNTSSCDNVTTPSLVISKIHYHPLDQEDDDSDDFEFIEISNNSTTTWDLTGVYFGGLGFSYQVPSGFTIEPNQSVYLANKKSAFESTYGFAPFDEFYRNLSNSSETLELLDGFGNIIDTVTYNDDSPWPEAADGDGSYLELSNIDSDNSLPENWIANSNFQTLKVSTYNDNASLLIYPNPVVDKLYLSAINGEQIQSVEIISLNGQKMMSEQLNETRLQINTSKLASGIYFISIKLKSKTMIKRIIKN
jgi:hypothetical protein